MRINQDQKDLLVAMVAAQQGVPKEKRDVFVSVSFDQGDVLLHRGFDANRRIYRADLDALVRAGYVYVAGYGSRGSANYEISPEGYEFAEAIRRGEDYEPDPDLKTVDLEDHVKETLIMLVEAHRAVPHEREAGFILGGRHVGSTSVGVFHVGFPGNSREISPRHISILEGQGLITIETQPSSHSLTVERQFFLTSKGMRYYEYLMRLMGAPSTRVEESIVRWLNAEEFRGRYPDAYRKWAQAEGMLHGEGTGERLSLIGHLCREAFQAFTTYLVDTHRVANAPTDEKKTVGRLQAVLSARCSGLGDTESAFLDALVNYFGAVADLHQRQEHGAQKEGGRLTVEDGRRVVFQTALTMFEVDRVLRRIAG